MEEATRCDNRDSWTDWISTKVATAEAAFNTAFAPEQPVKSRSMHNLRAVAKASHLANARRLRETNHTHHEDHNHDEEVLPSLPRRASGLDVALSNAWGVVRRVAVAAMTTFDKPAISHPERPVETTTTLNRMTIQDSNVGDKTYSAKVSQMNEPHCETADTPTRNVSWDAQSQISHVTQTASLGSGDFSQGDVAAFAFSPEYPSSTEWEHVRTSAASSNLSEERSQGVLTELELKSNVVKDEEHSRVCESQSSSGHGTSEEDLNELLHAFNTMFEQNGGADCVSQVKKIGDDSLATMKNPVNLIETVEKELNHAKQRLDEILQNLDSDSVHINMNEVCSEYAAASAAAEALIEETKEKTRKDMRRRNASLLRDCCRLLAVFATNICASILERVERDKDICTWSERVKRIEVASSRGISQLRIISIRFAEAMEQERTDLHGLTCQKDFAGWTAKVVDVAVENVVQCVALAVAAMQVEVAGRAYECCV